MGSSGLIPVCGVGASQARGEEAHQGFGAHWDSSKEEVGRAGCWEGGGEEGLLWQPLLGMFAEVISTELMIAKKDLPLLPGQELCLVCWVQKQKRFIRRLKLLLVVLSFRWHHCHLLLCAWFWQSAAELGVPRTLLLLGPLAAPLLCAHGMWALSGLWGSGLCSQGVAAGMLR